MTYPTVEEQATGGFGTGTKRTHRLVLQDVTITRLVIRKTRSILPNSGKNRPRFQNDYFFLREDVV